MQINDFIFRIVEGAIWHTFVTTSTKVFLDGENIVKNDVLPRSGNISAKARNAMFLLRDTVQIYIFIILNWPM
jgi:hypothetical protein